MTTKRIALKQIAMLKALLVDEVEKDCGSHVRGLSSEGFSGGYKACLDDIEGILREGIPPDKRGYYHRAKIMEGNRKKR